MLLKFLAREATRMLANAVSGNPLDLPQVARVTGSWHHADIEWLAAKARDVPGDFAEIGVFRGAAFCKVAELASIQGRHAHAFDSFFGMGEPSAADGTAYPKGRFDIGGPDEFVRLMTKAGVVRESYDIWPGYVPACFAGVPDTLRFAFVILDVDHYQPTVDALRWLPARINDRGILALDDYLPKTETMASKAIKEFLATDHGFVKIATFNQQLILRKRNSH
jgi:O-methyltransferase